jgi:hypothetical protein
MSSLALTLSDLAAGTFGQLRISMPQQRRRNHRGPHRASGETSGTSREAAASLRRGSPSWRSEATFIEAYPASIRVKTTWAWAWPIKRQEAQKTAPQNAVLNYSRGPYAQEIFT